MSDEEIKLGRTTWYWVDEYNVNNGLAEIVDDDGGTFDIETEVPPIIDFGVLTENVARWATEALFDRGEPIGGHWSTHTRPPLCAVVLNRMAGHIASALLFLAKLFDKSVVDNNCEDC